MRRKSIAMCPLLLSFACGGDASAPSAQPTPTKPARATLTLGVAANGNTWNIVGWESYNDGRVHACGDVRVAWLITESAGLGARLVQADVYLLEADGDVQDRRVTPGAPADVVGAGRQLQIVTTRYACGWNNGDLPFVLKAAFDFHDDSGNTHALRGDTALRCLNGPPLAACGQP